MLKTKATPGGSLLGPCCLYLLRASQPCDFPRNLRSSDFVFHGLVICTAVGLFGMMGQQICSTLVLNDVHSRSSECHKTATTKIGQSPYRSSRLNTSVPPFVFVLYIRRTYNISLNCFGVVKPFFGRNTVLLVCETFQQCGAPLYCTSVLVVRRAAIVLVYTAMPHVFPHIWHGCLCLCFCRSGTSVPLGGCRTPCRRAWQRSLPSPARTPR